MRPSAAPCPRCSVRSRCARGVVAPILVAINHMHSMGARPTPPPPPSRCALLLCVALCGHCFSHHRPRHQFLFREYLTISFGYLPGPGVIHRDLKPENIVIDSDGVVMVADFGLSIDVAFERPVTRLGTLDFMAPEVLRCPDKVPGASPPSEGLYGGKVDAWAIGVIAFEALAGHSPFSGANKQALCDNICTKAPLQLPEHISSAAKDFIGKARGEEPPLPLAAANATCPARAPFTELVPDSTAPFARRRLRRRPRSGGA